MPACVGRRHGHAVLCRGTVRDGVPRHVGVVHGHGDHGIHVPWSKSHPLELVCDVFHCSWAHHVLPAVVPSVAAVASHVVVAIV